MKLVRQSVHLAGLALLVGTTVSCGDVVRQGRAPVYLVIDSLQGVRGSASGGGQPSGVLESDVLTMVTTPAPCTQTAPCPTIFSDGGVASFHLALKNINVPSPTPTTNNAVTITRYEVAYRRADGRNTPGVDVPYGFSGAGTVTVTSSGGTLKFELVRTVAKEESPLAQLVSSPNVLTAIADVTFYGQDQVGNEINVTGSIQINFANFGDQ